MKITTAQQQVLDFCLIYSAEYGNFPSARRIARHFGWASQTAAVGHVNSLIRKGKIERCKTEKCLRIARTPVSR